MKKIILFFVLFVLIRFSAISQNVGVNTTGATPNAKALLDLDADAATKSGLLVPRMTTAQRSTITAPIPESLLIYNTTTQCFEAWNQTSLTWVAFGCIGCQLPGAFTANAASGITATSFDANWTASVGATTYYLDVATDIGFTSFVTGYNNLNVGNVTTYSVNTNLTCATTYYYRLRANNSCGTSPNSNTITVTTGACWSCGSPFTDARDGKSYNTVLIGSQCWMKENLNYSSSGTFITGVTEQTNNGVVEKYCHFDDAAKCTTYGGLYQWGEMVQYTNGASNTTSPSPALPANLQGICPSGWHLPTDAEWCTMENAVEAGTDPACSIIGWRGTNTGAKLKTTTGWDTNNGTNTSGFSALPGGYRWTDGSFGSVGDGGNWWTVTESSPTIGWRRGLTNVELRVLRDNVVVKVYGISVRCVKD